ncbi:MAG: Glu/Leu/Phe/Val dehydrogenase [Desulfobacterales bacterium]|nr:Glu/Leu/Phe/Val dehydrogenase [Desulfobacterales bacterium]
MKKLISVSSPRGYLAIDSTINGKAWGGVRFQKQISKDEICRMAHAMTLKFGFLGIPQGGAKAVIIGNPDAPRSVRRRRLLEFGREILPFLVDCSFNPAGDMGTSNSDIEYMLSSIGVKKQLGNYRSPSSGFHTAVSVAAGAEAAMKYMGRKLAGATVAIDGFGSVGSDLGKLLLASGAQLVGIGNSAGAIYHPGGIHIDRFISFLKDNGPDAIKAYPEVEHLTSEQLMELPVDLLCPCSIQYRINTRNIDGIQARIICAGANLPITSQAESLLLDKGILCLPHFITNCGGVLGGTMEFASIPEKRIRQFIKVEIYSWVARLLALAEVRKLPCTELAEAVALNAFDAMKNRTDSPGFQEYLMRFIVSMHHQGWLPKSLVGAFAPAYFKKSIAGFTICTTDE